MMLLVAIVEVLLDVFTKWLYFWMLLSHHNCTKAFGIRLETVMEVQTLPITGLVVLKDDVREITD